MVVRSTTRATCSEWGGRCLTVPLSSITRSNSVQFLFPDHVLPASDSSVYLTIAFSSHQLPKVLICFCYEFAFLNVCVVKPLAPCYVNGFVMTSWLSANRGPTTSHTLGQLVNSACLLPGPQRRLPPSTRRIHEGKHGLYFLLFLHNCISQTLHNHTHTYALYMWFEHNSDNGFSAPTDETITWMFCFQFIWVQ